MKVKKKTIMMRKTFPRASQNSASPYHFTTKALMQLFELSRSSVIKWHVRETYKYKTMQTATTAATGILSLQYVKTRFNADISKGMRNAS